MAVEEITEVPTYDVPAAIKGKTDIDLEKYQQMYQRSIDDPEGFWADMAEEFVTWDAKWDSVLAWDFEKANIEWFKGGKLNVSYNCLDRHVEAGHGDQKALIWEGNDPEEDTAITYQQLLEDVCRFANALKRLGVEKGDRVCMYMQMIPQLPVAMLACARIGAVHSIVFGAFSPDSLAERINDSSCKILITQDTALRGKKNNIPMKTKRILNESTVCHLAQNPKFVGIKHSSEDITLLSRFRQIAGGRLMVWSGRDAYYLGALAMGASGAIGSSYSLTGDVYMEITRAYRSGDVSRAMKLQNQINEVHRRLQVFGPYKSMKYCFSLMGIEAGNCRIPFKPIAPEAGEYLRETLVLLDRIRQ